MSSSRSLARPLKSGALPAKPKKKPTGLLTRKTAGKSTIRDFYSPTGFVKVRPAAAMLGLTRAQLLETAGIKPRKAKANAAPVELGKAAQRRLQEMLEIISRISAWAGGNQQAVAWYRAQPLPEFGSRTAESLVKDGKAAAVRDYLDHVALGGFA